MGGGGAISDFGSRYLAIGSATPGDTFVLERGAAEFSTEEIGLRIVMRAVWLKCSLSCADCTTATQTNTAITASLEKPVSTGNNERYDRSRNIPV